VNALAVFDYAGQEIRTVDVDGEPWFVAADVARILGYRMASDMTRRLDDDERGTRSVRTPSGDQDMTVISESGVYVAILGSQVDGARDFKRWLTREVLPQIRRSGSFGPPTLDLANRDHISLIITAGHAALQRAIEAETRVAELEPQAAVASRLLDADGDLSVAEAAQSLTRAGIKVGGQRLFRALEIKGWIYRNKGDGRWRVYQSAIEGGWMSVIPMSHYHPKTGVLVLDPPQPRVTPKGLQRLLNEHGALEVAS
jgi:anti-repressor protein